MKLMASHDAGRVPKSRARVAAVLLGVLSSSWIVGAAGQPHVIGPREDIESADVTRARNRFAARNVILW